MKLVKKPSFMSTGIYYVYVLHQLKKKKKIKARTKIMGKLHNVHMTTFKSVCTVKSNVKKHDVWE